jgi:hypothetical protein
MVQGGGLYHHGEPDAYIRGRLTLPTLRNVAARRSLQDLFASHGFMGLIVLDGRKVPNRLPSRGNLRRIGAGRLQKYRLARAP